MIWVWIIVGVLVYVFIGIVLAGIQSGYSDDFIDEGTIMAMITFWILIIIAYGLYCAFIKPYEFFKSLGIKIRKRKDDRK